MAADGLVAYAPARVNLIGEHTDYNDGLCLPFTIDLGVSVEATRRFDRHIHVLASDLDEADRFSLDDASRVEGWRAFVRGTAIELGRAGYELVGADLRISGSVPRGRGLSSSAALTVGLALSLLGCAGQPEPDRRQLAQLCSRVENDWLGARTGLLDQLASLFGRPGHALRVDLRDLTIEPIQVRMDGWHLVVVDAGERQRLAALGYNERRAQCLAACEALGIASLRDASRATISALPEPLDRRARFVVEENERVEAAVSALKRSDMPTLGGLLDRSHEGLRDLYEVSVPAVESAIARVLAAAAAGARMIGGGFGGSVLALFPPNSAIPQDAMEVRPCGAAHI